MYLTDKEEVIYTINSTNTKIISLDEDGLLMSNASIIPGTCLLPPPEAKIAEADGNEALYDMVYSSHLLEPFQQEFMAALIAYLFKGGNLILFLPEIGYTYTQEKLIQHIWNAYGLHIGLIGSPDPNKANWYADEKCIPIWLNLIYLADVMSPEAFLYYYPVDAVLNNQSVLAKLIDELKPYGESINDQINAIDRYKKSIKENPKATMLLRRE